MMLNHARLDAQIALYQEELNRAQASVHALSGAVQACQQLKAKLDEPEPPEAPPTPPSP